MNIKKVAVGMISSVMVLTMGIGSYATSEVEENKVLSTAIQIVSESMDKESGIEFSKVDMKMMPLTEAQLAQKQAETEAKIEKWAALSESEKAQIYDLSAQSREVLKDMVKKYLALDLIDQDEADKMLEQIAEQEAREKEEGYVPSLGHGFGKGIKFMDKENIDAAADLTTESIPEINVDENTGADVDTDTNTELV